VKIRTIIARYAAPRARAAATMPTQASSNSAVSDAITWAVGDGATVKYWTDAHAYTVVKISPSGKTVTIQRDKAIPDPNWKRDFSPGGFMGHTSNDRELTYTYEADPQGATRTVRLTQKGWASSGQRVTKGRHEFYDSNF
jgi:hypothetical protein